LRWIRQARASCLAVDRIFPPVCRWLEGHPDGYFVNTERNLKPNYLVLHRPDFPHFKGSESLHWTKDYVKICSTDRAELEEWAANTVGGEVTLCRSCFG
jgi:hypothetical protein